MKLVVQQTINLGRLVDVYTYGTTRMLVRGLRKF